jgi:cephalosporin-C deacetylase-like acetyl esterase
MAFQAFNQKQLASIKAEKNAFVNKDYQTYWEKKIEQVGNISEDFKE